MTGSLHCMSESEEREVEREVAYRYVPNETPLCPTIRECRHAPPGVRRAIAVMDRRFTKLGTACQYHHLCFGFHHV